MWHLLQKSLMENFIICAVFFRQNPPESSEIGKN